MVGVGSDILFDSSEDEEKVACRNVTLLGLKKAQTAEVDGRDQQDGCEVSKLVRERGTTGINVGGGAGRGAG